MLLLAVVGCDDGLASPTLIERMRLLGAKTEVVGDEMRSTPRRGEEFDLSIATAFPILEQDASDAQSMLVTCTMPDRFTGGLPVCQELIDLAEQAEVDPSVLTDFDVKVSCKQVPDGIYELGTVTVRCLDGQPSLRSRVDRAFAGEQMLYRGVICERGEAFVDPLDPLLFGCDDDDAEQINFHGTIPIERKDDQRNHNPNMADAEFRLAAPDQAGPVWDPVDLTLFEEQEGCRSLAPAVGIQVWDDTGDGEVVLRFDPATMRDDDTPASIELVDGEPEELEFSVYATAGELERRFLVFDAEDELVCAKRRFTECIEPDEDASVQRKGCGDPESAPTCDSGQQRVCEVEECKLEGRIAWTPPKGKKVSIEDSNGKAREVYAYDRGDGEMVPGLLVRFFVTVLDGRGGFDWTTRALCLK
jgi:hypothetical protein